MKKIIVFFIFTTFLLCTHSEKATAGVYNDIMTKARNVGSQISQNIHPDDKKVIKDLYTGAKGYQRGAVSSWKDSKGKGVIERSGDAVMGGSIGFAHDYLESEGSFKKEDLDRSLEILDSVEKGDLDKTRKILDPHKSMKYESSWKKSNDQGVANETNNAAWNANVECADKYPESESDLEKRDIERAREILDQR